MVNYNFENFHRFRWKNCQNRKIVIFWYFTKIDITQVQNDIESWNLAKLCTIILSKKGSQHFLIFYVFFEILPNLSKIWSKSWKNCQIIFRWIAPIICLLWVNGWMAQANPSIYRATSSFRQCSLRILKNALRVDLYPIVTGVLIVGAHRTVFVTSNGNFSFSFWKQ